jgi:hypothetical protein
MDEAQWAADGGEFTIRLELADGTIEVPGRVLAARAFVPYAEGP